MASEVDRLDAARMMERACRETGLADFGDPTLGARVAALAQVMEQAGLDPAARERARAVYHWLLADRLRLFDDHRRHRLDAERILRPLIVTGEARCGTTFAQMLFGQDPDARLLKFWEVMHPSPPPSLAPADDPRIARADADWREILAQIPAWLISHPYNDMLGANPPECERLWAMDFRNTTPTGWWRVPLPMVVGTAQDPPAQYRVHRMMLQQIQHGGPVRRWVLKGTQHHHRLPTVLETYPDAVVVWIHRDPVQALASRVQLLVEIQEGIAGPMDRKAYAALTLAFGREVFARLATDSWADDPRVHHVLYKDFTRDPIGQIRRVYARAGLEFTPAYEAAMQAWMPANRSDRYGRFRYPLDVFDTPVAQLHEEFAPYRERFSVEIEMPRQ
ncbi:MAG: sulfotransferase [Gammaproteobacteria bacterium]